MKEIDLKEILLKEVDKFRKKYNPTNLYTNQQIEDSKEFEFFISAMKEACKETLELAAENAKTRQMTELWSGQVYDDDPLPICVDKQSILDTINQIK